MNKTVDLNSDLGEGFGSYKLGLDEDIIKHVTSANIACGWHSGDPLIMQKTIKNCIANGVGVGAHPSYPDLLGFGRRKMDITPSEAGAYILYQIGALEAFAKEQGTTLQHFKLHGAFYNTVSADPKLAEAVVNTILNYNKELIIMALSGSYIAKLAKQNGLRVAQEVFADRAYNEDGSLVNRKLDGAVIHDENEAIARTKKMVMEGKVTTIDGKEIDIVADSICVHGDNPEAINFVIKIRKALEDEGIKLTSIKNFL